MGKLVCNDSEKVRKKEKFMKKKSLKMVASAALALTMLVQVGVPVYAESIETTAETSWKSDV